jgi:hypothetical protein
MREFNRFFDLQDWDQRRVEQVRTLNADTHVCVGGAQAGVLRSILDKKRSDCAPRRLLSQVNSQGLDKASARKMGAKVKPKGPG